MILKLGKNGIYTVVDAHQDILARVICGEGMPDFYAKDVLKNGAYCFGETEDKILKPVFEKLGLCKEFDSYHMKKDSNGNPLISECQKNQFFRYYNTPESFTLFRAFYDNT